MAYSLRLDVDPAEIPEGHSSAIHIKDKGRSLYLGRSNMHGDDREIIAIHLDEYEITAVGGETMREAVMTHNFEGQIDAATEYVFAWAARTGQLNTILDHIIGAAKKTGRREMREELMALITGKGEF